MDLLIFFCLKLFILTLTLTFISFIIRLVTLFIVVKFSFKWVTIIFEIKNFDQIKKSLKKRFKILFG